MGLATYPDAKVIIGMKSISPNSPRSFKKPIVNLQKVFLPSQKNYGGQCLN
jgi:hypothetical protein